MINIADGTSSSATNRVVENNLIVQRDDPSADGYYGDLFVNPLDPAPTLDDPRTIHNRPLRAALFVPVLIWHDGLN